MKPILKWQYEQLTKELLLLQQHAADPSCPCESEGEMCVRKHLLTIEALANETVPIETDEERITFLNKLALEAKEHRKKEEQKLCGKEIEPGDLANWAREKRKIVESYSLACEVNPSQGGDDMEIENGLCTLQVAQYTDPRTRARMIAPYYECPKCDSIKCVIVPNIATGQYITYCGRDVDGVRNVSSEVFDTLPKAEDYVRHLCKEKWL